MKIILQSTLFIVFLYYFGLPAFQTYLKEAVLVTSSKQETGSIPAPAVTVCGRNPEDEVGELEDSPLLEACNASENVFQCVQAKSWALEDLVFGAQKGTELKENLLETSLWKPDFLKHYACFTFTSNMTIGTDYHVDELDFFLNSAMVFMVYIHSPTFFLQNIFPALPSNSFKVLPPQDCNTYVRLSLTRVSKSHGLTVVRPGKNFLTLYKILRFV